MGTAYDADVGSPHALLWTSAALSASQEAEFMRSSSNDGPAERVCVWCKKAFDRAGDRKLHVSRLGAPGTFHQACFEEYERTGT
jgi:hypothetical protein